MRPRVAIALASLLPALLGTVGCAGSKPRSDPDQTSLYLRLGGLEGITAVVGELLQNIAADDRINLRFATADIPDLRQKLIDQICQATGGPCHYHGKDMKTAHAGMNVTGPEFVALCEDLAKAMTDLHVPAREQNELLTALGGLRPDIVSGEG
jgi:hemoglobin